MKKVFVLSKDRVFLNNVMMTLKTEYLVSAPEVEPQALYSYVLKQHPDILVIHNSYLNGFYSIIDAIVSSKRCFVLYGTALMEEGALYNALSSVRFFMIDDRKFQVFPEIFKIMERDAMLVEAFSLQCAKLKDKAEEERIVRKAKLFLMEKRGMTEEEAYKLILKIAMDERVSKAIVAKNIINGVMR